MPAKDARFRAKLIGGGRITIPTAIRELLGVADGDYLICSVKAAESEGLPPLNTLWRILKACRKELTNREIAKRCRLSAPASKSYLSLLVDEGLLSAKRPRRSNPGEETYRTTEKGLQIIELVKPIRGGNQ